MEYIIVEEGTGKIISAASRPDDRYNPPAPVGCIAIIGISARIKHQYYDLKKEAVVDMPPRPPGVATFNYTTKQWDVDGLASARKARAEEYPQIGDQLDALWKLIKANADKIDLAEVAPLLEAVQAVKDKYPKPPTNDIN